MEGYVSSCTRGSNVIHGIRWLYWLNPYHYSNDVFADHAFLRLLNHITSRPLVSRHTSRDSELSSNGAAPPLGEAIVRSALPSSL